MVFVLEKGKLPRMVNLGEPFTFENSSNPWLMDKNDDSKVLLINGKKLTATYLWSLNAVERKAILEDVFQHYRKNGFPKISLSDTEVKKEFLKLCAFDVSSSVLTKDGFISNSGSCCIDLCKYFCQEEYYKAKGGIETKSVREVFEDNNLFIRVLKNRMGWNTTKEGGIERPYLFPVSDKQILNGIRNSGLGYGVSNFRPTVAKWMYKHAADLAGVKKAKVFDYSGGWCARALGALSLGFDYDATDPLTSKDITKCVNQLANNLQQCRIYDKCSEDKFFSDNQFKELYDVIGSCPPYFDLEMYSSDEKQSVVSCRGKYEEWLEKYWRGTVLNCVSMLKQNGVFILVIKDEVNGFPIKNDMCRILTESGLHAVESFQYKTTTNHLSRKTTTGRTTKTNEWILFFKK